MEKEELEYIWDNIFQHLKEMSYDNSALFKAFKLEMMINIKRFLSPNSVEKYERNIRVLNKADIQESSNKYEFEEYLERLKDELIKLLDKLEYSSKDFNINKIEIMMVLTNFLNSKKYKNNIKELQKEEIREQEKQKMLTFPFCRW